MLLRPTQLQGAEGKRAFNERMALFEAGQWLQLLEEASEQACGTARVATGSDQTDERLNEEVLRKVRRGELSRARQMLDSLGLAAGTPETLAELRNNELRPPQLTSPLPEQTFTFSPAQRVEVKSGRLMSAIKSAGRGSARDLSGMRFGHLCV